MIEVRIYTITLDVVTSNYCDLKKEFESTFELPHPRSFSQKEEERG